MTKVKIMATLSEIMPPYEATVWLKTENDMLSNQTPASLILENKDIDKIHVAIEFQFSEKIDKKRKKK